MHAAIPLMQMTTALMSDSPHAVNKIVATVKGRDAQGLPYIMSRTNFWPAALDSIDHGVEIGNSSGWVHAETAAILESACTDGAQLFVTDPPCPNCMKNIVECGVTELYIDAAGLQKPYALQAGSDVLAMSYEIAARSGVTVAEVDLQNHSVRQLNAPLAPSPMLAATRAGPILLPGEEKHFEGHLLEVHDRLPGQDFVTACAINANGQLVYMTVTPHVLNGFEATPDAHIRDKYSYIVTSLTRLLLQARRMGVKLLLDSVTCQRIPTSRELVNFIGAGGRSLRILEPHIARDQHSRAAYDLLRKQKILNVKEG